MIAFTSDDIFVVAGASEGIGAASALLLNSLGAKVIAIARGADKLAALAEQSDHPELFHPEPLDLAREIENLSKWCKQWREQYGKMRGLLYCAGKVLRSPLAYQERQAVEDLLQINVVAAHQLSRAFLDRRNNIGAGSAVVFIASTGALYDSAALSGYAASKGALLGLSNSLAAEFAERGIRVNSISPFFIRTPTTLALYEDAEQRETAPLGPGRPEDVARSAAFLLSDAARWITGQNLIVDGGRGVR